VATGNTSGKETTLIFKTVHPRGYGEHMPSIDESRESGGSSPWLRGTPNSTPISAVTERFIPVATGNTCTETNALLISAVHPRGYGEHMVGSIMDH